MKYVKDEFGESVPIIDREYLWETLNRLQGRNGEDAGLVFELSHKVSHEEFPRLIAKYMEMYVEKMTDANDLLGGMLKLLGDQPTMRKYEVTLENNMFAYSYPPRKYIVEADGPINAITEAHKIDMLAEVVGVPKLIEE